MSGVILSKKANKLIPDQLIDKLVAEFPSSIGAAAMNGGELSILHSNEGADKDTFKLVQSDFNDTDLIAFLSKDRGTRSELDLQPYVLLKDANSKPLLVVFLAGNFPKFVRQNATNSVEWYVVEEDLLPRMRDTFDLCGSDITKTMERIKTAQLLNKDILNLIGDEGGVITFMASNGEIHSFERNNKTLDSDWGWVSNPLDYVAGIHQLDQPVKKDFGIANFRRRVAAAISPDKPTTVPAETTTPNPPAEPSPTRKAAPDTSTPAPTGRKAAPTSSPTPRKAAPASPTPGTAPPTVTPPTPEPAKEEPTTSPSVLIPKQEIELTEEEMYYQAPNDVTNKARLQALYRRETGFLPDNYALRPKVKRSNAKLKRMRTERMEAAKKAASKSIKSLQELGQKLQAAATTATALPASVGSGRKAAPTTPSSPTGQESEYPDTSTHNIPEEIEVGILSAAKKKDLGDFLSDAKVIKQIDKHSKIIVDPTKLQEFEAKRPTFTDISGLEMDDMINWPPQIILSLVNDHPEAAERLITQAIYERHHAIQLLNKKEGKAEDEKPTSVPSTRKAAALTTPTGGRRAASM